MSVKAVLWTYEKRQDGTADVKIYTYPPKRYHSTGIKIKPIHWDKRKGRVKATHPTATIINAKIERLIEKHTAKLHQRKIGPNSLIRFAEIFINEIDKGLHPISPSTRKNYQSTLTRVKQFVKYRQQGDILMEDCTLQWYAEFCTWLVDYGNCRAPGVAKHCKILKRLLRTAEERELHYNSSYRRFKANKKTTSKIYLRTDEIDALRDVCLEGFPHLQRERDRFLVSYFLLMRFGDSLRINQRMAYQDGEHWFLRYTSEKTGIPIVIPIKPNVLEIIKRNSWQFNNDTNQEANRHLKKIAALANINEHVREGDRKGPKWSFVTTHTARRSAATNLALAGVQIDTIAKLGGWEKISTLKAYLRASGVDVARAAVHLEFFR